MRLFSFIVSKSLSISLNQFVAEKWVTRFILLLFKKLHYSRTLHVSTCCIYLDLVQLSFQISVHSSIYLFNSLSIFLFIYQFVYDSPYHSKYVCLLSAEIRDAFHMFDKNGDGVITTDELGSVMISLGQRPSNFELKNFIRAVDTDSEYQG